MIKLTKEEQRILHMLSGSREEYYKLELVDRYGIKKKNLELVDGKLSIDSTAQIKRAASVSFKEDASISYLTDRIKPYMGIKIGNTIKWWALGTYLMIKPIIKNGIVNVQCFDETMILQQSQVLEPKLFLAGTNYGEVLRYFLISCGLTKINIESTSYTLPTDLIVDDSKNKLEWFNDLAEQINFTQLMVNSEGWLVSRKYIEPSPLNVGYIYQNNDLSVIIGNPDLTMDYWKIPNVFKRTVSNPEVDVLTSIYKNTTPTSPYSIKNRGFEIVDNQAVDNIANQIELDNLTRKAAFNASQIYQEVDFITVNMPHHEIGDILDLRHNMLKGIFVEQGYEMPLKAGGQMTHKVKRLVNLDV